MGFEMFPISLRSCLFARGLPWQGTGVCGCHRDANLPPGPCCCLHQAHDTQQGLQVQSSCAVSGGSLEQSLESSSKTDHGGGHFPLQSCLHLTSA